MGFHSRALGAGRPLPAGVGSGLGTTGGGVSDLAGLPFFTFSFTGAGATGPGGAIGGV
jgi:hypothetical protein